MTDREDCEEHNPRTAVFYVDGEQHVLRGAQIEALWTRLTPVATWEDKVRELDAIPDEVEP